MPYDYKKYKSKRKIPLVQCRHYKSKEKKKGGKKEIEKKKDKEKIEQIIPTKGTM